MFFRAAEKELDDEVTPGEFGVILTKLMARFGDGHARVRADPRMLMPGGHSPFLLGDCGDGMVAVFSPDRRELLDNNYPYLKSIDARPLDEWLAAAAPFVTDGSPQFVRKPIAPVAADVGILTRRNGDPRRSGHCVGARVGKRETQKEDSGDLGSPSHLRILAAFPNRDSLSRHWILAHRIHGR